MSKDEIKQHGIITDVLDDFNPEVQLNVSYGGSQVQLGNELTPTQVQNKPNVSYQADNNSLYTLILTDPDAPSRQNPKNAEWWHWGIVNIPGGNVSQGDEVVEYVGAGPPQGTGLHRYILILYKQSGKIDFPNDKRRLNTNSDRAHFKARQLASEHGLTPVGLNMFQAQYDDYVPKLYAQFK